MYACISKNFELTYLFIIDIIYSLNLYQYLSDKKNSD